MPHKNAPPPYFPPFYEANQILQENPGWNWSYLDGIGEKAQTV